MRVNENALRYTAKTCCVDKEGRMQYKPPKEGYRQRWFKLKGNLLFYFRTNEMGQQSEFEPLGMILLEECVVQLQPMSDHPFVFSINFQGEGDRMHLFSCSTEQQSEDWVTSLTKASIDFLKAELMLLQNRIQRQTGKDPIDALYRRKSGHIAQKKPVAETRGFSSYRAPPTMTQPLPTRVAPPPPSRRTPSRIAPPPPQAKTQSQFFTSDVSLLSFEDNFLPHPSNLNPARSGATRMNNVPPTSSQKPNTGFAPPKPNPMDGWELFD